MTLLDMMILVFFIITILSWIAFEIWAAPLLDDNLNTIVPAKKLRDLFKKK
jgi:hypothetical protein